MERSDTIVLSLISVAVIGILGTTAWLFLLKKDYDFVVEAPCDPQTETCFYRECSDLSNTGDCPPNALENYKIYVIRAADFPRCTDNSCSAECGSGLIACTEILCGDGEEDTCATVEETIQE